MGTAVGSNAGLVGDPLVALYCSSSLSSLSYKVLNVQTRTLRLLPCDALCKQDYYFQNLVAVGG
jgi:hypothetical protein